MSEARVLLNCRRHLNIRGKSANLPAITEKDWLDLQFGIDVGVDYYALSFVRSAEVIYELKAYLAKQSRHTRLPVLVRLASHSLVHDPACADALVSFQCVVMHLSTCACEPGSD